MSQKPSNVELWADIEGYEGLYKVSSLGRVVSLEKIDAQGGHRKEKILKPIKTPDGYLQVRLHKNRAKKWASVHRLVANAFMPNLLCKPQINHIDEDPQNNRLENLEWVTARENANWGSRTLRQAITAAKPVEQFTFDDIYLAGFWGAREAGRITGLDASQISSCCRGETQLCGGFVWRYRKCDT